MRSVYEEFGFFGAVVRLSIGIMIVAVLFALLAVTISGCSPPEPSTGRAEIEVETPADAAVEVEESEVEIGETTDEAEAIEEAVELILEDVDAEEEPEE